VLQFSNAFGRGQVRAGHPEANPTAATDAGERVRVIVVRQPDPKRWDLARLRRVDATEDLALAEAGLSDWDQAIDSDQGGAG
jgi:hypothetical protein